MATTFLSLLLSQPTSNVDIAEASARLKALLAGFSHRCLHRSGRCFNVEVLPRLKCQVCWSSRDTQADEAPVDRCVWLCGDIGFC
ncbi:hypothetical protein CesoFtcFv8_000031 [Champsocephalus esox]|uniref:Uncharacterized protein n=1 Tax=Champsocephalus esox TaxID=159716 RepID=A0AAN8HX75_9TELE|nr:hypothetical protein CesoFtcFv8_000031 [Champsocephalus esox]